MLGTLELYILGEVPFGGQKKGDEPQGGKRAPRTMEEDGVAGEQVAQMLELYAAYRLRPGGSMATPPKSGAQRAGN